MRRCERSLNPSSGYEGYDSVSVQVVGYVIWMVHSRAMRLREPGTTRKENYLSKI